MQTNGEPLTVEGIITASDPATFTVAGSIKVKRASVIAWRGNRTQRQEA